jgi:hypothetical protein
MRLFGTLIALSAALALIGGLSMGVAQAAPAAGKVAASSQLDLVAKKKSAKKGGPGTCGVMNYWDKKTKKCASAMTKKV